jgi:DNA-binding MarR family transcriptional regulator
VIPSAKSVDLAELKRITENHKRILAILAHDPTTGYTYQEIAEMSRLTPNGVRGMISQLSRMGYRFKKAKQGKKVTVKLIPSASSAQALPQSASSG